MYGVKVRFPHSLVMTFLFHEGSLQEKLKFILQATFQHARNLALLTTIYKTATLLLRKLTGRDHPLFTFLAAFAGGYFVFGENNKINMQVNLYLLSRITLGLVKVAVKKGFLPPLPRLPVFSLFAGLMWGVVLCLFEYQQETLQQSLQNSMTYIYHDSFVWSNVWDFLVYNSNILW